MKIKLSNEYNEYLFNSEDVIIIDEKLYELTETEQKDFENGKIFTNFLNDLMDGCQIYFDLDVYISNPSYELSEYEIEFI